VTVCLLFLYAQALHSPTKIFTWIPAFRPRIPDRKSGRIQAGGVVPNLSPNPTYLSQYSVTGTRRCVRLGFAGLRVVCVVVAGGSTAAAKSARVAAEASAGGAGGHTS